MPFYSFRALLTGFAITIVVVFLIVLYTFSAHLSQKKELGNINISRESMQKLESAIVHLNEFENKLNNFVNSDSGQGKDFYKNELYRLVNDSSGFTQLANSDSANLNTADYKKLVVILHQIINYGGLILQIYNTNPEAARYEIKKGNALQLVSASKILMEKIERDNRTILIDSYKRSTTLARKTFLFTGIISSLLILVLVISFRISYRDIKNKFSYSEELKRQVEEKTAEISNVFERVTDAFVALDKNWGYTYVNEKAALMHGRKAEDLIGKNIWVEFPDVIKEPFYAALHESMKNQTPLRLELYYSTTDSWFEDLIYPSPDGVSVYYHDITQRKKVELKLAESEEKYRTIIEQASDGIFIAGPDSFILEANNSGCVMMGYSKEELQKMRFTELVTPESLKNDPIKFDELNKGNTVINERRLIRKDDSEIFVEISAKILLDGRYQSIIRDITERKKAEEELKASKEKLQQVLISMAESFYVIDKNYCVTLINKVAERNLQKAWGYPVTVGTNILEHMPCEKIDPVKESFEKAFAGEKVEYELHLSIDDLPPWLLVNYAPVFDENKNIIGASIVTKDITERKRAEDKIRQTENEFRQLVDTAPDATVIVDENGIIRIVNQQTEILLGYQRNELIGQPVEILIPDGLREIHNRHREKFHAEIKTRPMGLEKELFVLKKNGTKVPVEISLSPFHSDKGILITASIRDITERREAERIIRESEKQLSIATQIAKLGYWEYDVINDLYILNDPFYAIYKTSIEETGSYTMSAARYADLFIYPEDMSWVRIETEKGVSAKSADFNHHIEHRFVYADGEIGYISVHFYIVKDEKAKTIKIFGVNQDITDRKKAEEGIQRSNNRFILITRTTNDAVWEWNLETNEFWANENHQHLYGLSLSDPIPTVDMWAVKIHPDDRQALLKEQAETLASDKNIFITEYRFYVEGKGYRDIYDRCYILRNKNGKPTCMMGSMMDITERKAAEEALKESEERYKALVENAPEALVVLDMEINKFVSVSESAMKFFKMQKEELLKIGPLEVSPEYQPDGRLSAEMGIEKINEAIAGSKPAFEWTHCDANGKLIPCEVRLVRLPSENKVLIRGSIIDITERKKAQDELEQSYKAIRHLSDHLQKIREEERIHIAREIHDELGQHLTVMKMDVSWLNKKLVAEDELIKQKLKDLTEMLNGTVKTVRRISSELRPSLLDDLGLVAAIEWQLKEFEKRFGIKTSFIAPEAEKQLSDAIKTGLYRILQESLTNVARHADSKMVKVELQHKDGKVILSIEDDGKGFDKKKTVNKRTLGILGMKERTLMMGGEYEIKSTPGKGTTVLVAIPEQDQKIIN